jgi:long-chain acyl-CoA synthetase
VHFLSGAALWWTVRVNLADVIEPHSDDAVAIISRGRPVTFGDLRQRVGALRGALLELGIEPGDRVALMAANNPWFVVSYLAVLGVGGVVVPINPLSPPPEVQQQLASVGARAAVVGPSARSSFSHVDREQLPVLEHVLSPGAALPGSLDLAELFEHEPAPMVDRDEADLAALLFTSGTAGAPRAAMLTHGNLVSNLEQCQQAGARAQTPDDVVLGVLPFFHIFGLNVVLGLSLRAGSPVVAIERFDPQSALEAVQRHRITVVSGAPAMWAAWATLPDADAAALESVRIAVSGAARLDPGTRHAVRERFGVELTEGYGLTEASPVVTSGVGVPGAPDGSIGVPIPGVQVRLVDSAGHDALVGDAGEIWVHGPNVFAGYWNDPEATLRALGDDGWLRTGDVAVVDDDGFLFLVDRIKDLIIVSGFNVFPAEVEEVIATHPAVAQVAVVGVPHPHSGEAVKAYVVLADGGTIDEEDIIEHVTDRLARYKAPQKVMFVDELPVNAAGKVLRRELR